MTKKFVKGDELKFTGPPGFLSERGYNFPLEQILF